MTGGQARGAAVAPAPAAPSVAARVFGPRLELAEAYAGKLAGDGTVRGLLGPREVPRLWDRHLLNCAVLTDLLPQAAHVVDVGSGAGLPGLVIAIRRPDLRVTLVEPMQRRVTFLSETVAALGLAEAVRVVRGRVEDPAVRSGLAGCEWVTARAVAPLDRLVEWCLPLVSPGGQLLALKGARAGEEVAEHRAVLRRAGAARIEIRALGEGIMDEPTWVVAVVRAGADRRRKREGDR